MRYLFAISVFLSFFFGCQDKKELTQTEFKSVYMDYSNSEDQYTGGINMIPITTPKGTFNVYTNRVGTYPTMRVFVLYGGADGTQEFFDCFDGYFPNEDIEYVYYDQLDTGCSDKPSDSALWTTTHFVEEAEQVRKVLNM